MSAIIQGKGDVFGPVASVDGEMPLFSGTTGKLLKRETGTGFTHVSSGVAGTPTTKVIVGDTTTSGYPAGTIVVPRFVNHPDKVIPSPNAFDDHFEGSSLNAKWTNANSTVNSTTTVSGSKLHLGGYSPSGADGVGYKNNVWAALPNASNFQVTIRWEPLLLPQVLYNASIAYVDIQLFNVTSNVGVSIRGYTYLPNAANGIITIGFQVLSGLSATTTTGISMFVNKVPNYVRLTWSASAYTTAVAFSDDGVVFANLATITPAQSGFGASTAPQRYYIGASASNGAGVLVHVDWVRFENV